MRTDQLIELLGSDVEEVRPERLPWALIGALIVGALGGLCVALAVMGLFIDIGSWRHLGYMGLKLVFALSTAILGAVVLVRAIRPGRALGKLFVFVFLPMLALSAAAIGTLVPARPSAWVGIILGGQWSMALLCIPLFAIVPFVVLIWTMRRGAPTDLTRAGAIAGLVAGALGAAAYALFCPDDSLPFIAVWYSAPILFTTVVGALLGRPLLRW
jgi:hypothetical protein